MASTLPRPDALPGLASAVVLFSSHSRSVWQAPLMMAALASSAGLLADRYGSIPTPFCLIAVIIFLFAWFVTRNSRYPGLPLSYLGITIASLAAAYHHSYREGFPADDIGNYARSEPRPVRVQGVIAEEPTINWQVHGDPLQSMDRPDPTVGVLEISRLHQGKDWMAVSGKARLIIGEHQTGLHVGDEVEVVGRLVAPNGPANPGEFDYAAYLRDHRIRAQILVRKTADGVKLIKQGWPRSLFGWLGVIRAWGQAVIQHNLSTQFSGVAIALLLGEGSTMTPTDWDKYLRTGVIHVLAVSGQHLVILAGFLWLIFRVFRLRRRTGALAIALILLAYSLLTGGRPPAMRSAVMVCVFCLGILLRRPAMTANSFALGWLVVAGLNPTDVFGSGCLLSFLAVAVLYWGTARWFQDPQDPLERLVDEARPLWQKMLRRVVRQILLSYAVTLAVWLAVAPLVAGRFHLVSPVAVLIGPPVVFFTTIALLSGFLLLLVAAVCGPIVPLFAGLVQGSLAVCDFLIHRGQQLPFAYWYVSDIPDWWLWGFYLGLLTWLTVEPLRRFRWMSYSALLIWIIVGGIGFWLPPATDDFRCTFLAVGHGGCTVLETPDGRVLLYDAGAMTGPDVTRRQIAPFLWQRGLRRVDEVFLSHADIDHFNGLNALVERFSVGQVTCTPTFAEKKIPGVPETLNFLQKKQIPIRIVRAGDRLAAGPVLLDVLHPPENGPDGKENFRSLVIHVRYGDHALLLTGDLEGPGLDRVLTLPLPKVDVLMAPHHGSRAGDARELINRTSLAIHTQPRVIVSCQGLPKSSPNKPDPYAASGALFFGTWPHGAITIRSGPNGLFVETFQSQERLEFK